MSLLAIVLIVLLIAAAVGLGVFVHPLFWLLLLLILAVIFFMRPGSRAL